MTKAAARRIPSAAMARHHVSEVGVPVAVPPVDREAHLGAHRGRGRAPPTQGPVLPVDGADPAELQVVGRHLLHAFGRDRPAAQHVFQERRRRRRALRARRTTRAARRRIPLRQIRRAGLRPASRVFGPNGFLGNTATSRVAAVTQKSDLRPKKRAGRRDGVDRRGCPPPVRRALRTRGRPDARGHGDALAGPRRPRARAGPRAGRSFP